MFQGLSTALTALYADQQALETTGNNIANANTEGYSRQRVDFSAQGNSVLSFWATNSAVGQGVKVDDISRIRDQFLEVRSVTEHANQGRADRAKDVYNTIEGTFGEPGDNGLQSQLSEFWSSWDDLANNPGDLPTRSQVVEKARTLTGSIQQIGKNLDAFKNASTSELKSRVSEVNTMAKNIGDLNTAIQAATSNGDTVNSLLDQRDLLVNQMSQLVDINTSRTANNSIIVSLNGVDLVRDGRVQTLQVDDSTSPVALRWDGDKDPNTTNEGQMATVTGGDIGGLMTAINITIPRYVGMINDTASKLISVVNTQQTSGRDLNGNVGGPFFVGTKASDIDLDATLGADPKLIAAAGMTGATLDSENARAMANLANNTTGPDSAYRNLIDVLGVESDRATRQAAIQKTITDSVDSNRLSVSGVNLDEEMTNMVRYQKAYGAAAKYLNVMNEVMDTLLGMI